MKQGKVFNNHIYVGLITQLDDGRFQFEYDNVYFMNENYPAISLTLPKNQQVYLSDVLFPFFFNMLSEGRNKIAQSRILKIDENDHFAFLIKTASTESIGAIRVEEV